MILLPSYSLFLCFLIFVLADFVVESLLYKTHVRRVTSFNENRSHDLDYDYTKDDALFFLVGNKNRRLHFSWKGLFYANFAFVRSLHKTTKHMGNA